MARTNSNMNNSHPNNNKNNKPQQNNNTSSQMSTQSYKNTQKAYLNVYLKELTKSKQSIKYGDSIDTLFNMIICISG